MPPSEPDQLRAAARRNLADHQSDGDPEGHNDEERPAPNPRGSSRMATWHTQSGQRGQVREGAHVELPAPSMAEVSRLRVMSATSCRESLHRRTAK